jgi:phosphatidate cytidylyltransferase
MAYVCGRLIGGAKLWPRVSPNKTWAGLIGGLAAGVATASLFHVLTDSSPWALGVIGGLLALVAQAGDLAESALKRVFGVKDASHLIPGHGGFMDRADGVVAAAIVTGLIALFLDPEQPAWALFGSF